MFKKLSKHTLLNSVYLVCSHPCSPIVQANPIQKIDPPTVAEQNPNKTLEDATKAKRQSTVEPVFGTLTQFMGLRKVNTIDIKQANKCMQRTLRKPSDKAR